MRKTLAAVFISNRDNSANNKYNPGPPATIRWGDQCWDEMLFAWVGVVAPRDTAPETVMVKPANIAAAALTRAEGQQDRIKEAGRLRGTAGADGAGRAWTDLRIQDCTRNSI